MQIDQSSLMRQCLEATVAELSEEFRGVFSRETVARYVESAYEDVGYRRTVGPNFLPVIIARFAREQLWAAAQADGRVEKALPEVLFVCERNAGRSQMAAAFAHHLSNGWPPRANLTHLGREAPVAFRARGDRAGSRRSAGHRARF